MPDWEQRGAAVLLHQCLLALCSSPAGSHWILDLAPLIDWNYSFYVLSLFCSSTSSSVSIIFYLRGATLYSGLCRPPALWAALKRR